MCDKLKMIYTITKTQISITYIHYVIKTAIQLSIFNNFNLLLQGHLKTYGNESSDNEPNSLRRRRKSNYFNSNYNYYNRFAVN